MAVETNANENRLQRILEIVLRDAEVSVDELAQTVGVSTTTIRRALTDLEKQGLLRRTHGGATVVTPQLYEPFRHISSFQEQEQKSAAEKRRIGLAAAEMVEDGDIIAIGAGTTTTQFARGIRHRKDLTIVTNAVNIAMEMSHQENLKIIVTGGELSAAWFALVGGVAIETMSQIMVDKVFIGVDGAHPAHGFMTNYADQAAIHRQMIKQAKQRIVLADHRKLGATGTVRICAAEEINCLITDQAASKKHVNAFYDVGIAVRCA